VKVSLPALLAAVIAVAVGCSSSPSTPAASPASGAAPAASPGSSATPSPSPSPVSGENATTRRVETLFGFKEPADVDDEQGKPEDIPSTFVDPKTGKKLMRIPKSPIYYVRNGRLFNAIVNDKLGILLVSEDEKAYIIAAPGEGKAKPNAPRPGEIANSDELRNLHPIVEIPADEAEAVTPPVSHDSFRFEELSDGLPRSGMWRQNFALGDLDGSGRPQIVATPARLTAAELRVFKLGKDEDGKWRWRSAKLEVEDPENIGAYYGGVALGDMDGDGRLDIVFGGHGSGPAVAYNQGNFKFRIESRGLPRRMSTRAVAVADVNGDGKPDILAISDISEYNEAGRHPRDESGYLLGYDARLFLNEGSRFREVHGGLEKACFGYALTLVAPAEGAPFYASDCHYIGGRTTLFSYDRRSESFSYIGEGLVEQFALEAGVAAGTYHGYPAAYTSYFKRSPDGAVKPIDGQGISIYYRKGDTMQRKRVVKTLQFDAASPAIAAGDLNGDGLDDVVWADESTHRVRVFFQTAAGEFEELDPAREPVFVNHPTCLRIADVDGDGRKDVVLMYQYLTGDETRAGGFRVFRGLSK
jgi:FG-GAP-like repeat